MLQVAILVVVYIQQHISWAVGFSICTGAMLLSLVLFLMGSSSYIKHPAKGSPFTVIARVVAAAWVKRKLPLPEDPGQLYQGVSAGQIAAHG
jgi:peptide/histidine transporter 3/4